MEEEEDKVHGALRVAGMITLSVQLFSPVSPFPVLFILFCNSLFNQMVYSSENKISGRTKWPKTEKIH